MNTETLDKQANELILAGKAMEAFEAYYADDVVMCENFDIECIGKDANRKRELEFFEKVEAMHSYKLVSSAVQGDLSFAEWVGDFTFKGGARVTMKQVSVRRWKNGKIVHERFYYKGA